MSRYSELRTQGTERRGRHKTFSEAIRAARVKEQALRNNAARNRAFYALKTAHQNDYREFYREAFAEVNAERGPLPGDKSE